MKKLLFIPVLVAYTIVLPAQDKPVKGKANPQTQNPNTQKGTGVEAQYEVHGTDTLIRYTVNEVNVPDNVGTVDSATEVKMTQWYYWKQNVDTALRYARIAKAKMDEIEAKTAVYSSDKEKRKFFKKQEEDKLRDEFTARLKNLSLIQGQLLVKLISRETGHNVNEIIKGYKNGMSAFWWRNFAKVWGVDLKEDYDRNNPKNEKIEAAIQEIDAGRRYY